MKSKAENYDDPITHNHLCNDCGQVLHASNTYCEKSEDHRVSGRCETCWSKLGEFWVLEHADAYGIEILKATHSPDDGRFARWYACRAIRGLGRESIKLDYITWRDLELGQSDGSFQGCSNAAWILSDEQRRHFIGLNQERANAETAKRAQSEAETLAVVEAAKKRAQSTNEPQELERWVTGDCHSHLVDCSFDIARRLILPDGSHKVTYSHCF